MHMRIYTYICIHAYHDIIAIAITMISRSAIPRAARRGVVRAAAAPGAEQALGLVLPGALLS